MNIEEQLSLLKSTLGTATAHEEVVEKLRSSYRSVRQRAGILAQRIASDLPDLTVHDQRHLATLWVIADELYGEGSVNPLRIQIDPVRWMANSI